MDHLVGEDVLSDEHRRVDVRRKERVAEALVVRGKGHISCFPMKNSDWGDSVVGVVVGMPRGRSPSRGCFASRALLQRTSSLCC